MPFIVTEPCVQCKYTDCVEVCPMDCFVEGPNFLAIDPAGCIDCSVCVPQCPVDAIVNASEATQAQRPYIAINAQAAQQWPSITRRQPPLPEHGQWAGVSDKLHLLISPA
ncbi:ferredoxin FdxA [Ideonella oryzae]|uniref:Ferredoxin n=1 Tax=Ideonella oryzae TaxID=2937441 RepID=A0ABT1BHR3_9BURK|nr:ferredoxin FdxA [Ideonella oryzae]MCO5975593.1 ferredoxin family protein [Ideonella oryzae]